MQPQVRIILIEKQVKSANPTTGIALYHLANQDTTEWELPAGASRYYLWRKARGNANDECIIDGPQTVQLKPGDEFYWAQTGRRQ